MTARQLLSTATIATVGLLSKAFLRFGTASVTVNGLQILLRALESQKRDNGRGIITVSNHISTLDDPVTWGVLPVKCYFDSRTTRWTLGASDIMFTNSFFSEFFRLGQTIETFRGKGVYQPAVDTAIDKLNQGCWVHLYSEGKICQPMTYARDSDGNVILSRFKWGIGRIIMEANIPPVIIPVWLTGFDQVMPEGRSFPYKYIPRLGTHLTVTFGDPLYLDSRMGGALSMAYKITKNKQIRCGCSHLGQAIGDFSSGSSIDLNKVRSGITEMVRQTVLALGRKTSGGGH